MNRRTAILLIPLFLAGAAPLAWAGEALNWRGVAWPEDVTRVEAAVDRARAFKPEQNDDAKAFTSAQELLARASQPRPLGAIEGNWQVRSIQVVAHGTYAYPRFKARIDRDGENFRFDKLTGSQRRGGTLFPFGDGRTLAFLGGSRVNDEPHVPYSRIGSEQAPSRAESDTSGRLVRIGAKELLLILDASDGGYELYHLRR
ncbi:DUF4893 domain-containing protein [Pyxidicoccus fallax]|uniref:DUF4893 domain-containing protein n=1 Tax=Pyxidicoccus fallax TaxID=394095 RepID=A0A848L9L7_9BACT|nr:DUF4893 domain-containing protein [Pyxidicoccus fallax]NMO13545.1 DUF4893 domain-containing protein [Pyxidicoccus fallax]NPC76747.1 DUF4893 domain-containing protein [Pyxidicoccus fallax]